MHDRPRLQLTEHSRQKSLNRFGARIDRGARDRAVAEPSLDRPGVVALVGN
jgi:hypothetical protein